MGISFSEPPPSPEAAAAAEKERIKEMKRDMSRATREIGRQIRKMEESNKAQFADLKSRLQSAKGGREDAVFKIKAKQYAQGKAAVRKFYLLQTHLEGMSVQMQMVDAMSAMNQGMTNASKVMGLMMDKMKAGGIEKNLSQFQFQMENLDQWLGLMGEGIDDAMATGDAEGSGEAEDALVNDLMAEITAESAAKQQSLQPLARAAAVPAATAALPTAVALPAGAAAAPQAPAAAAQPRNAPPPGQGPPGASAGAGSGAGGVGGGAGVGGAGSSSADALASRLAALRKP